SLRFGVTIAALQATNGIADANLIFVGQVLCIPNGTAPIGTPEPFPDHGFPVVTTTPGATTMANDIGVAPPINAIGNFLDFCGSCTSRDINATQRQYRQNTLVCASVKPVSGSSALGWY